MVEGFLRNARSEKRKLPNGQTEEGGEDGGGSGRRERTRGISRQDDELVTLVECPNKDTSDRVVAPAHVPTPPSILTTPPTPQNKQTNERKTRNAWPPRSRFRPSPPNTGGVRAVVATEAGAHKTETTATAAVKHTRCCCCCRAWRQRHPNGAADRAPPTCSTRTALRLLRLAGR